MAGRRAEVVKRLGEYEQANGTLTPRLRKLKDRPNTEVARKEELRIAVLLPFHLDSVAFGLPTRGRPAMTFLAGLRLALEHERPFPGFNAVEVDVYDTRGQETRTRQLLDSLATKMPDVVIGDFVAASSRLIGSWCQQKLVLHIVPLSPVASLVDTLQWSFLASPTLETQAAKMAQLVTEKLRMRKVMVITDGSASSTVMADTFIALLNAAQITTLRERVPNFYNYDAVHQKMRANRCDGLYMPVFNQGVVNYAINRMFEDSLPLRILGVYDWQLMEEVDPDLLAHFTLYYHGAFFRDNDSTRSREFESEYRLNYHNRGTREAVVAYDLVHWLLEAYGTYTQALPLNQVLHKMPPYRGIAQNYWFGTAQTNQSVRVLRYRKDGTSEEAAPTTTP
jgi:ABC-type branched-subunit amino acid transport system substrate-binding protein